MSRKLHILVLSSWYPTDSKPYLGNFIKRHVELIAQKHLVTVLDLQPDFNFGGFRISQSCTNNLTEIIVHYPKSNNTIIKWLNARKAFKLGAQSIQNVDIIHGNVILSKGLQFIWAKKHFRKPLVITEHASYYSASNIKSWNWSQKLILKAVINNTAVFSAVSNFLSAEINKSFPRLTIEILPNVIDETTFSVKEKTTQPKVKFIHVSTLDDRYKNISGIIDACASLKESGELNFELEIISDENFSKIELLVREKLLSDLISFSGPLSASEIATKMHESVALILFSNYETFSCVIAESWATGTPVISTSVGIATDLDKKLGIQVEENNVPSLVAAMRRFVLNDVHFIQSDLQAHSKQYFATEVMQSLDQIYQKAQPRF